MSAEIPHEVAERARRAKALLEDPLFVDAQRDVRAAILAAWSATPARDQDERERLYCMDQMLTRVVRALRTHIETGRISERELSKDRFRLFGRV
jgi:hypothetical protein